MGGPNTHPTNPRWQPSAILKQPLNRHISAIVWSLLMKFGILAPIGPHTGRQIVKISNFSKTKMAAAAILKNHKNRDITAMDWPIFAKFGMIMQNGSLNRPDSWKNLNCQNPRWRTAAILKTVKSPYLRNRLTDFNEIWHRDVDWPPTGDRPLKYRFFKNQDGGGRHLEKPQKSRYHNNGLADLRKIWRDYAKWVS